MNTVRSAVALTSLLASFTAQAGVIEVLPGGGRSTIYFYEPVGQSFTAEDERIKFAFHFASLNPSAVNTPLTFSLVSGAGLGGTTLATQSFSLATGFSGYYDIDLSSTQLIAGQIYTAFVSTERTSAHWAVSFNSNDVYAGGQAYSSSNTPADWAFRVTPTDLVGEVPEPGSVALMVFGLAALRFARRTPTGPGASA